MSRCEHCGDLEHTTAQHQRRYELCEVLDELLAEGLSHEEITELVRALLEERA